MWGWETLSSLYRTSPFLILDFEDKTMYEMNKGEDPVKADGPVIINNEKEQMEDLHHDPGLKTLHMMSKKNHQCLMRFKRSFYQH